MLKVTKGCTSSRALIGLDNVPPLPSKARERLQLQVGPWCMPLGETVPDLAELVSPGISACLGWLRRGWRQAPGRQTFENKQSRTPKK